MNSSPLPWIIFNVRSRSDLHLQQHYF